MLFKFDRLYYGEGLNFLAGIDDSKKLTPKKRDFLFEEIKKKALAFSIAIVDNKIIDEINILQATFKAMGDAFASLKIKPDLCLIDGNHKVPQLHWRQNCPQEAVIGGDAKSASIAAASILAKVARDKIMDDYAKIYHQYGFEKHKGYGTKAHIEAIQKFGACPIHRMTFAPLNSKP
ncbi:MAG: ribonuclease HII [Endomicrobium sp.]|jgi:ribonuclease HII|nr:ribonuclease HII [Endomicrobium sp.]